MKIGGIWKQRSQRTWCQQIQVVGFRPENQAQLPKNPLMHRLWQPVDQGEECMKFDRKLTIGRNDKEFSGYPQEFVDKAPLMYAITDMLQYG